jgi:hypothetical protein
MKACQFSKRIGAGPAFAALLVAGMLSSSSPLQADDIDNSEKLLIQQGFAIAPVHLNLAGKNPDLVGLGSFIVNAVADCNGCHTSGGPPSFNYTFRGNPYFGERAVVDPTVYLGGGSPFGQVGTPTGPSMYAGPVIISRNLTPDRTGRAEGGRTLSDFKRIIRNGTDLDHLHPTCTAAQLASLQKLPLPNPLPNCIPTSPDNPVDGNLLQIMPWPVFNNMSDHYLEAIYEYLSAIPCIDTKIQGQPQLRNQCQ